MKKTVSVAALFAVVASSSFAGSLNTTYEAPPEPEYVAPVAGSSAGIGAPAIVGGVLAAAAVAALISDDNDSDTTTPVEEVAD